MSFYSFTTIPLPKSPQNIQKCLLPQCEFSIQNYGRYCLIRDSVIVKLGLCDIKSNEKFLFIDCSVIRFSVVPLKKFHLPLFFYGDDFKVLNNPVIAKKIKISVSFFDVLDHVKYEKNDKFKEVLRDFLQFYTFKDYSVVLVQNQSQNFGLYCILVTSVEPPHKDLYQIDKSTEIHISFYKTKSELLDKENKYFDFECCSKERNILSHLLFLHKTCINIKLPNKILLIGQRGYGKSDLVRCVTKGISTLLEISASHINSLAPEDIEKHLKIMFDRAKAFSQIGQICVVLVENIDMMATGKGLQSKKFVGVFINFLEEIQHINRIIVIATTSCPEAIDPQLRNPKRFADELECIPDEEERREFTEAFFSHFIPYSLESFRISTEYESEIKQIVKWTPGFVKSDLILLFSEAAREMLLEQGVEHFHMNPDQFLRNVQKALTKVVPSALRGAIGLKTSNTTTFSDIGGLGEVKNILNLAVKQQLIHSDKFKKFGIPLTKGILLYGPPGCAKTTLVKALAKECNTNFLATSAADLYSPYVGEAEKKIVRMFSQARISSPSIIFIDEIDAVVGSKSGDREQGVQERLLSTLLVEMDGVGIKVNTSKNNSLDILNGKNPKSNKKFLENRVIVIGATNRPQDLDSALKRPGRFDKLLYVPPPDEAERLRILEKLTENMSIDKSVDFNYLAKNTEYFSGADLKSLCIESGLHALYSTNMTAECITQAHFNHVLKDFKPSLNKHIIQFYESFKNYNV